MRGVSGWKPVYITFIFTFTVIAILARLTPEVLCAVLQDDGLVQVATAALLCFAAFLGLLRVAFKTSPRTSWAEATWILWIYAMREMDFHRLFTGEHVTRIELYTGPFPIQQKVIGGVVMLTTVIVMLHFFYRHFPVFWKSLKEKVPRAWYIVAWAFLLVGSQVMDKPEIYKNFPVGPAEEAMELGASLMMVFILLSFPFRGKGKNS